MNRWLLKRLNSHFGQNQFFLNSDVLSQRRIGRVNFIFSWPTVTENLTRKGISPNLRLLDPVVSSDTTSSVSSEEGLTPFLINQPTNQEPE